MRTTNSHRRGTPPATRKVIDYDSRSFIIRGKRELLIGGEFHYFRTPCELWEDRLLKMRRGGANLVTTYIPWNWHEPVEGKQRWTGDRDLGRFLELCTRHGMYIIVKPGPYICAEWDFGGHPDWLLGKRIPLRVLDQRYLAYVDGWYRSVARIIRPHLVTRGGNVFAIQVENEYDHLLHYGDEKITLEDAREYFARLRGMMDRYGIDIPKFANEAAFLRGSGIIDTRTYYPNIPWLWEWELAVFDRNIAQAQTGQPDSPTMILELQSGWFDMFGQPPYRPGPLLTEAVTCSVLMKGASVLNLYMFVGGTTFPFWTCRGDIYELFPPGTGTTTSFDFGGSPVHEWGELMPGRYDWMKTLGLFTRCFGDWLLESNADHEFAVVGGGEEIQLIGPRESVTDTTLSSPSERFVTLGRSRGDNRLVCVRNAGEQDRVVDIGWAKNGKVVVKGLDVRAHETFLLPVNFTVPGTPLHIHYSTSSLLFAHRATSGWWIALFGKQGRRGETVLQIPAREVEVLAGKVEVTGTDQARIRYVHEGIQVLRVGQLRLVILDQSLAAKVELIKDGVLIADAYFVEGVKAGSAGVRLNTRLRNGSRNQFTVLSERRVASARVGKAEVALRRGTGLTAWQVDLPEQEATSFTWSGDWRAATDTEEAHPSYSDAKWRVLPRPISLEEAGLLEHGYIWYRGQFTLPPGVTDLKLNVPSNATDRMVIYVNGTRVWSGVTDDRHPADPGIQEQARPGRNLIAILYQNFYHNKSHPHEGEIQKYSGIMGPVIVTGQSGGKSVRLDVRRFKVRPQLSGVLRGYTQPEFDDSAWMKVKAGGKMVMAADAGEIVWLRRGFTYQRKTGWEAGARLTIPDAKDRCFLYVNGRAVGQFEHIGPQHDFYIPETFLTRRNVLAILLEGVKGWKDFWGGYLQEPRLGTFHEAKSVPVSFDWAT